MPTTVQPAGALCWRAGCFALRALSPAYPCMHTMLHGVRSLTCSCYRVHWPDYLVLAALLVTLVISETIPPVTRRIYHVGPDGAASALETWQCAALPWTLSKPEHKRLHRLTVSPALAVQVFRA